MKKRVVILGGGIGGMSAAHELAERGFSVEVLERNSISGGKARSLPAPNTPDALVPPIGGAMLDQQLWRATQELLPGEHGFRFFPGFYRHVIDTMARIPLPGGRSVVDNLVDTTQVRIARLDRAPLFYPARFPQQPTEVLTALRFGAAMLASQLDIDPVEVGLFLEKMVQLMSSCDERRNEEYERRDWWEFVDADRRSPGYQALFADGFTRSLVAAKAKRASAKTVGNITIQMLLSMCMPGTTSDRVLNGPTTAAWIAPWMEHLQGLGVKFRFGADVVRINSDRGRVRSVTASQHGRLYEIEGDYFVAAVPVEQMAALVTPALAQLAPELAKLDELSGYVEWMNGVQFYLTERPELAHGHTLHLGTPWALTSVAQGQFWTGYDLAGYADGKIRDILSVCVSDWDVAGLNGKSAEQCTRKEIVDEVWNQLKRSLNTPGNVILRDEMLHYWFMDPAIQDTDLTVPGPETNAEPLLVNYSGSWALRPEATTRIPNLFLASDYVRTNTDLATMEAANEAARRAVNGILEAEGSSAERCGVWRFEEPAVFEGLRAHDRTRWENKLPWDASLTSLVHGPLEALDALTSGVTGGAASPPMRILPG